MKNEELYNIISLDDEDGNEARFEFLDLIEYNGSEYVVLFPVGGDENSDFVILELEDDEETYVGIDDEETIEAVFEIFKERVNNEFEVIE